MIRKLLVFTIIFLFLGANFVFAESAPVLVSPINNSTINQTTPKLSWDYSGECYTKNNGSCYYIEIDDSESFSNIDKFAYIKTNKNYSPQKLSYGKWFWHVKAKNPSGIWSAMSDTWSFTLEATPPSEAQTPHSIITSTPKPSETPITKPSPTLTPTPNPTIKPATPEPTTKVQKTSAYQILVARASQNHEATVAAVATTSSSVIPTSSPIIKSINISQINMVKIAGVVLLLTGITISIFFFIKSKIKSNT